MCHRRSISPEDLQAEIYKLIDARFNRSNVHVEAFKIHLAVAWLFIGTRFYSFV